MEILLKTKQSGNDKFNFLDFGNELNDYYKFLKALRDLLVDGTAILEKEIQTAKKAASEPDNISNIVSLKLNDKSEKGFVERQHIHNPGTKEACEQALHKDNRVLQLVEEGDLQWDKLSKYAPADQRSVALV